MPAFARRTAAVAVAAVMALCFADYVKAASCASECSTCLNGRCVTCKDGYYYNKTADACQACTKANCLSCDNNDACVRCSPGYTAITLSLNGTPSINYGTCSANCVDGTYRSVLSGECEACTSNCRVCYDPNTCSTCNGGYTYTNRVKNNDGSITLSASWSCVPNADAVGGKQGAAAPVALVAAMAVVAGAVALVA